MNQKTIDMNNFYLARARLLQWQPTAMYIRLEKGKCPDCKRVGGYVSYQLPEDMDAPLRDAGNEQCAYYCAKCDFTAAGSRKGEE